MGVGAQPSLGDKIFLPENVYEKLQNARFFMIFARKMPRFYIIIARKICFPIFLGGRGGRSPCPPPVSYAYMGLLFWRDLYKTIQDGSLAEVYLCSVTIV